MRVVGVDVGARRIGLAISDPTRTLARPLETIEVAGADGAAVRVARRLDELAAEEDGVAAVVVGVPRRLDGTESDMTKTATAFVEALRARVAMPVIVEDERLTSVSATGKNVKKRSTRPPRRSSCRIISTGPAEAGPYGR